MLLETIKSPGLAHLSYLLGDESAGVCAVIDPRRDTDIYLEIARKHHLRITHILETHIHADFVSGSRELAAQTDAPIYVGAADGYGFPHRALQDGDGFKLGSLTISVLHTPGHTPEHISYLVRGGKGSTEPWAVFTGDTLFAGEVGRPDLLGKGSAEKLARLLFHSLHDRLLTLGDDLEIYPAHGQGSPCGGSIGDRNTSTIGYERLHSPKLQITEEGAFVKAVLSGLPPAPTYYPRMKKVNAEGPPILHCLPPLQPLNADAFQREARKPHTVILDAREIEAFGGGHIKGALNIALRDEFPLWSGWMLSPDDRVLLVLANPADVEEAERYLLRIGIENIAGFLRLGMRGWFEEGLPFERTHQMSVQELHDALSSGENGPQVLDVRREDEWDGGHIPSATHQFVPDLARHRNGLQKDKPAVVYCGSGYRASIAASILQQKGFADVSSVPGSMAAWKSAGYEVIKTDDSAATTN